MNVPFPYVDPADISSDRYMAALKGGTPEDGCVLAVKAVERRLAILREAGYIVEAYWLERVVFTEGANVTPPPVGLTEAPAT